MTRLIIDVLNICFRNHFIHKGSWNAQPNHDIHSFLRDLLFFMDVMECTRPVFCFDSEVSHRANEFPYYKNNRTLDPEDREKVYATAKKLRTQVLPSIGFLNSFLAEGWEADDLIAHICLSGSESDSWCIVSSDSDLYQLLSPKVSIWSPVKKQTFTEKWFEGLYKIPVEKWVLFKAIAGDPADGIKGVPRVGVTGALDYLRGCLATNKSSYKKIVQDESLSIIAEGQKLIRLPYRQKELAEMDFSLVKDKATTAKWNKVMEEYKMPNLIDKFQGWKEVEI